MPVMPKKPQKKKVNEICDHGIKKNIPDEYKYHQLHHQELYNYNLLMKKQKYTLNSVYFPKKNFEINFHKFQKFVY